MKRYLVALCLCLTFALHADIIKCGSGWWSRYKQNYGMEKITTAFPNPPTISRTSTQQTATAWHRRCCYTLTGYYPPVGNIDTTALFQQMSDAVSVYPFSLDSHRIYENSCGNWVLEYTAQDHQRGLVIHSFTVVTPFNAYTLQCTHPFGGPEYYLYFRDSFLIACECQ